MPNHSSTNIGTTLNRLPYDKPSIVETIQRWSTRVVPMPANCEETNMRATMGRNQIWDNMSDLLFTMGEIGSPESSETSLCRSPRRFLDSCQQRYSGARAVLTAQDTPRRVPYADRSDLFCLPCAHRPLVIQWRPVPSECERDGADVIDIHETGPAKESEDDEEDMTVC